MDLLNKFANQRFSSIYKIPPSDRTKEQKRELDRVIDLEMKAQQEMLKIQGRRDKISHLKEGTGKVPFSKTIRLNKFNRELLKQAQRVKIDWGESDRSVEFGGGLQIVQRFDQGKLKKKQELTFIPWGSDYSYVPNTDVDFHTHPVRYDIRFDRYVPDPRKVPKNPNSTRYQKSEEKLRALDAIQRSILFDDRPSIADINYTIYSPNTSLIITPRQKILMVPTTNLRKTEFTGKQNQEFYQKMHEADQMAYDRAGVNRAESVQELEQRIELYRQERKELLSQTIESESGVRTIFYDHDENINIPVLDKNHKFKK